MGNFDRGNRGGGRDFRRDSGRGGFDNGRGAERQMHQTTCSNCGKNCEVPFKPTGSKPVYCSDCFKTMGGGDRDRRVDDRGSDRRPNFSNRNDAGPRNPTEHPQYKEQFETLNAKLDKIIAKLYSETPSQTPTKSKKVVEVKSQEVSEPEIANTQPEEEAAPVKAKKKAPKKVSSKSVEDSQTPVEPVIESATTSEEIN